VTSTNYTNNNKRTRKIYGIIGAFLTLLFPFFFMLSDGDNHLEKAQSLCPFKMLSGLPCPGCGITKSMVYCYEGDLYKSFSFHAFGPFLILFCMIAIVVLLLELYTQKEYGNSIVYHRKGAYFLAGVLIVYHIIRLVYFIKNNDFNSILEASIWR